MKNVLFFAAGGLTVALILGLAGFAFAQTQTPQNPTTGIAPFGGRGYGMIGGWNRQADSDFEGPIHDYMIAALAEELDITPEALESELEAGKTVWQVAEAKNISLDDFNALMLDARAKALENAVTAGVITQQQADYMTQRLNKNAGSCRNWQSGPMGRWNNQPIPAP